MRNDVIFLLHHTLHNWLGHSPDCIFTVYLPCHRVTVYFSCWPCDLHGIGAADTHRADICLYLQVFFALREKRLQMQKLMQSTISSTHFRLIGSVQFSFLQILFLTFIRKTIIFMSTFWPGGIGAPLLVTVAEQPWAKSVCQLGWITAVDLSSDFQGTLQCFWATVGKRVSRG